MAITHHIHHDRHEAAITDRTAYLYFAMRVIAGMLLLLKGIYFISHSSYLNSAVTDATNGAAVSLVSGYIAFAHLFGGAFIMLGLLTRVAVVLQLPIVAGALVYNLSSQAFGTGSELVLSLAVLMMLIYIFYRGSGPVSMDRYLENKLL